MTSRSWSWVGGLILLVVLLACDRGGDKGQPSSGATGANASAATSSSAGAAASVSATASAAPSIPEPPRAPAATIACKAAESGKRAVLGTRTDGIVDMEAWGDRVYLLGHRQRAARTTIAFFTRDGADKGEIGKHEGLGKPESFRLTRDHGYFVQKKNLMRIPLAGGEAQVVSEGFAQVMTVYANHAYGMRCAAKGKTDELVRVAESGGDPKVLATIERTTKTCKYGDIAVRADTAFVTEWEGRRLLSVDLKSGELTVLTTGHGFASTIFVRGEDIDFSSADGLSRVPQAGGKATKLTEVGSAPFAHIAEYGKEYWIFQGEAYSPQESIWRFSHDGKKASKVWTFPAREVVEGSGVHRVAVDDQCYYYPMIAENASYTTILARPKKAKD